MHLRRRHLLLSYCPQPYCCIPNNTICCVSLPFPRTFASPVIGQDVKRSRAAYMMAKMIACTSPLVLLCIAIDGADQSAYSTPYFCQETKDTVKGWKPRLKLIGALVSGHMCMFYTLGSNWESGRALFARVTWLVVACLSALVVLCHVATPDLCCRKNTSFIERLLRTFPLFLYPSSCRLESDNSSLAQHALEADGQSGRRSTAPEALVASNGQLQQVHPNLSLARS